jgi:hypothetical protein
VPHTALLGNMSTQKTLITESAFSVHMLHVAHPKWRIRMLSARATFNASMLFQVYGITWNPHVKEPARSHFLTWGKKHCKLWTQAPPKCHNTASSKGAHNTQYISKQLSFARFDLQNVHSAIFLPVSHAVVLGLGRGDLLLFSGTSAVRSISAHHSGPQFIADDGSVTFSGLRGLALHHGDTCLLTAGVFMLLLYFLIYRLCTHCLATTISWS